MGNAAMVPAAGMDGWEDCINKYSPRQEKGK